ncbi:MAG: tetratricopeptide repeat protein, partial [Candidatus Omnitrophica bacterium]|nr:tetratricopeptide repeat protein [Candidatus Omnitrophota bacterium]
QAREEKLAKMKAEKQAREQAERERLAQLQAQKEQQLDLKRAAEARRQEQARLKKEQERQAKEERLARLKAEKEQKQQIETEARERNREVKLRLAQGKIHYYQEEYQQAIEEFRQLLLLDPEHPSAGEFISKCQRGLEEKRQKELLAKEEQAGRLKKTVELIQEEKEKDKLEQVKELYDKGKMYFRRGLYSEAIACFEQGIELEGNPRIYYTPQATELIERAKTKMEEEQKDEAKEIAEEQVERLKAKETQKIKAKQRAEDEVQLKQEELIAGHYKQGKAYYSQGNYPLAIAEFNKIKEISPEHNYALSSEKYIKKAQEKILQQQARELKTEMKKESQGLQGENLISNENLLEQARWYYKRQDYEQTAKICRAMLELDPLNKTARNLLYAAELKQVKADQKRSAKQVPLDEKKMLAEVAEEQILPEEEMLDVPEKEITTLVKMPAIREKLKDPITVDFRDVDLSYVLNFLADSCAINIIPASGVSLEGKKVTIRMKDIPAENALKYILKNQGLTYRIEQDAVWVASPSELDKEEIESRIYFLNRGSGMFAEFERTVAAGTGLGGAASISKITTLKDTLEQAVNWPKDSKLVLDERSGALVIANTPANLRVIEEILYNLDITPIQVLIEARFVELEVTDVEQLGIEWQLNAALGDKRRDGNNVTQWESGSGWDFTSFSRASEGLNLTYSGVLTYPEFQAVLHALSETQNAKTLSAPKVSTLNNQKATIKVVDEWIYPTRYEFQVVQSDINGDGDFDDSNETKYQNVPVDFVTKDVGILLYCTPNVGADGKTITLALVPEVSSGTADYFSYTGSVSLPKFTSRTLSTSVVISNGDTVVLGGLVKETTSKTLTKVPILGDIPIVGNLFRKQNDSIVRKNLLIFVTASIISPSGEKIRTVQQQK